MVKSIRSAWWSVAFVAALAGCSSSAQNSHHTEHAAGGGESHGGSASATPAELPPMPEGLQGPGRAWSELSPQERGHHMDQRVVPAMRALFRAYDGQRFAEVNCATCHGANAREVNFHMPNTLHPLPTPGSPAWQQMLAHDGRMAQFMMHRVTPAMAALQGEQPFNPETRQGFGCFECHAHATGEGGGEH